MKDGNYIKLKYPDNKEEIVSYDLFEQKIKNGDVSKDVEVLSPLLTNNIWVRAKDLEIFQGLYSEEEIVFKKEFAFKKIPFLTIILILINIIWFMVIYINKSYYGDYATVIFGAKFEPFIKDLGQWWRIITYNFVHLDKSHLFSNMFFLLIFGSILENAYSRKSYMLILAISALLASFFSYFFTPIPSAGSSGLIVGLIGGCVTFGLKYRKIIPSIFSRLFGISILPYLWLFFYTSLTVPMIDNYGHLGGLIGGVIICIFLPAELLEKHHLVSIKKSRYLPAIILVLIAILILGGQIITTLLLPWRNVGDETGLKLTIPESWKKTGFTLSGYKINSPLSFNYPQIDYGGLKHNSPISLNKIAQDYFAFEINYLKKIRKINKIRDYLYSSCPFINADSKFVTYTYENDEGEIIKTRCCFIQNKNWVYRIEIKNFLYFDDPYSEVYNKIWKSVRF